MQIGTFEAKNRLSELVRYVMETGEEVHITHRGKPMAKLVSDSPKKKKSGRAVLEELMAYADEHNIRSNGDSIRQMIDEGRKY